MGASNVEKKSHQVNLRFSDRQYSILRLQAKAMYDRGKIPENTVAALLRWQNERFQEQFIKEQAILIQQEKAELWKHFYEEFLREKYANIGQSSEKEINPSTASTSPPVRAEDSAKAR